MKFRLFYVVFLVGLITAFWACGDGEIYTPELDDEIAVGTLSTMSDEDREAIMEKCRGNSKCRAEMEKYAEVVSSSSIADLLSCSSEAGLESSSEEGETSSSADSSATTSSASDSSAVSSSAVDTTNSSSDSVTVSSSSITGESSSDVTSASSAGSSSEKADGSSSSAESSSSSEGVSTPSSAESSSAESSSSSEPVPVSSSSSKTDEPAQSSSSSLLAPHGTCTAVNAAGETGKTWKIGEPITWTYTPDPGTDTNITVRWTIAGSNTVVSGSKTNFSVVVAFSEPVDGQSGVIKSGAKSLCDMVFITVSNEVYVDPNASSSSKEEPSAQSSSSEGGSTDSSDDDDPPPVTPGDDDDRPPVTPGTQSSASSSGSTSGTSSASVNEITNFGAVSEYQPGSYKIVALAGNHSDRICNVSFGDSSNKIEDVFTYPQEESGDYWSDGCGRTITARPGIEFSFTTGKLTVSCF